MDIKIALAGNPNCGKTTLFNALTGSKQFVGNWPGVTVEKKEGRLKKREDVIITDLPGIYSLSPYTLEEVVARDYLIGECPDAILNLVDGTNLERSLYLTTQLLELGIPMVIAVNMMDIVKKNGDRINTAALSRRLGCRITEISALKESGITEAAEAAIEAAKSAKTVPAPAFSDAVERALACIGEDAAHALPEALRRWYAVKIFERDGKVLQKLRISEEAMAHMENVIRAVETEMDDDAQSIIINERYLYISAVLKGCCQRKSAGKLTPSDRIDKVVTSRWLGLPIFAVIMFIVYWVSVAGIGSAAADWANDGFFGDGWHLFGIGSSAYEEAAADYADASRIMGGYEAYIEKNGVAPIDAFTYETENEETLAVITETVTPEAYRNAVRVSEKYAQVPDPADYGVWIPGVPKLMEKLLDRMQVSETGAGAVVRGLVTDGIVAGVGAVLGFLPQMLMLFLMLAFLEACGYMARIAFVLDRVLRRFGLSGKSFIPMLIGTGCSVPGIMASRTIENERDRKMTVMTTTFIPCGAKVPLISMMAGALFAGSAWVAVSAYLVGVLSVIVSGILLKKTRLFAGDTAPFVMELPAYHLPSLKSVLRSMWERGWSFIQKAGTILLLSTILIWFASHFGFASDGFRMLAENEADRSVLAAVGGAAAWIFKPLGWGSWQAATAAITGLAAKENIVSTLGVLYGGSGSVYVRLAETFTRAGGYSFMIFNLLCAPCFAAIGAIRREMNSAKWTWFAVLYQCGFAYAAALMVNQFGNALAGRFDAAGLAFAVIVAAAMIGMLARKDRNGRKAL